MDTTFGCSEYLFENSSTTSSQIYTKISDAPNSKRFKFKPLTPNEPIKQNPDLVKLNLNSKKDFQKKLLNFDINRNFEDIYWLSLKEKPKFSSFYDKTFKRSNQEAIKLENIQTTAQSVTSTLTTPGPFLNKNNSGDSTKKKKKVTTVNDSVSNTAAVLVDLNRQSINLPLTPIKDDFFKNRYFENYLLNRKSNITSNISYAFNSFNSSNTNQLSTIYFKPPLNTTEQLNTTNLLIDINDTITSKNKSSIKLEAIEGSKINIRQEELSPRKVLISCNNFTNTAHTARESMTSINTANNNTSNLLGKTLYKIKEDEKVEEPGKLVKEEPIQTQFRLKPLNNKPINLNQNLLEEISEQDFDLYDKKIHKNYLKNKEKLTKPIKMFNHKLPNGNSEEVTNSINANSDLFSAKATCILSTPPTNATNNPATTSTVTMNSKTKLAKIIKTEDENFINRKPKNYIYNQSHKKQDENSSQSCHSSEEEEALPKAKVNKPVIKPNQYEEYVRVESPHKLGKSMPDGYMFVGSSSIQVNSNANNLLNQQFQLFQSQIFDK